MNSRDVIGKRIVKVAQSRTTTNAGVRATVDYLELEDGTRLLPRAYEMIESPIGDLQVVMAGKPAGKPATADETVALRAEVARLRAALKEAISGGSHDVLCASRIVPPEDETDYCDCWKSRAKAALSEYQTLKNT